MQALNLGSVAPCGAGCMRCSMSAANAARELAPLAEQAGCT
ncbi:MAG: hypothetical protein ACLS7Z_11840 [Christensenellales bacterium]